MNPSSTPGTLPVPTQAPGNHHQRTHNARHYRAARVGRDATTSIAISGRRIRGLVAMLASSRPNRSRSDVSDDRSSEDDQMAHVEPRLRRTEPRHPDAATFPGLRRLDVVDCRSEGLDLDARSDHACIIGIRRPSGIVPRFQPNAPPVRNPTRTRDHPP
jgi:hypothetical protein